MEDNKYKDMLEHIVNACNNYHKLDNETDKDLFIISNTTKDDLLELTLSRHKDNDYESVYNIRVGGDNINTKSEIAYFKCIKDCFMTYVK